jgi:hypothetical protein
MNSEAEEEVLRDLIERQWEGGDAAGQQLAVGWLRSCLHMPEFLEC